MMSMRAIPMRNHTMSRMNPNIGISNGSAARYRNAIAILSESGSEGLGS
jgi:hypothetical protein